MRKLLIFLLTLFVLFPLTSADVSSENLNLAEIEDKVNSIVHYAEEYEVGNINYFQLNVYGHKIRSDINLLLGGGIGNEWGRIPKENVVKIFGTPTDYTNWVWVDNKHMEKRFDDPMPWWEKVIFDGRKVRIIFNAFPSAIEFENGTLFRYYSVDLNVRFKKEFDFDLDGMMKEVSSLAADYNMTRMKKSGEILAKKMLETQSIFGRYAQDNSEQCMETMETIFEPEEKSTKEKVVWWRFSLYNGSDFDIIVNVDMCEDCEFHYVNFMLEVEGRGPMNVFSSPELQAGKLDHKIDEEYFQTLSVDDIYKEFKKTVFEVRDDAEKFDKTRSSDFPKKFFFNRFKVQQLNRILDGKYNNIQGFDNSIAQRIESGELQGPGGCKNLSECQTYCEKRENVQECGKFTYNLRVDLLEDMFAGFKIEKTPHDRIWWERRVFENLETRQNSWCRHANDIQCNENEGCVDGKCVLTMKGNETCDNGKDDDGDDVVDCQDTDCFWEKLCRNQTYMCSGREYDKPCNEINITCGKNQILTENDCVCKEGFKDCDNDGNCESTKACGFEICDDNKDNNNDDYVDCQDSKCNRQVCGSDNDKELLCINKMCISPEEEIVPQEPEPICGNHILEEGENEESCPEDYVVCEVHEPPKCPNGKIVWGGKNNLGCLLPSICVVTEKKCEINADCPQPKCGVSQCIDGGCKVTELTTECEEGCVEGKTKKRECKDGSEIITALCSASQWVQTGKDCAETVILPVILPEENISKEVSENITKELPPEKIPENKTESVIPAEQEIPSKAAEGVAQEVEEEMPEVSDKCVLMNDCGGSQDVCSNGNCVTLPIPVMVHEKEKEESKEKPETVPQQSPPEISETSYTQAEQGMPTGSLIDNFRGSLTGWASGLLAEEERPCMDECKPCEECNHETDQLRKRIESGEISGPDDCKNWMECENYCSREEHKEECENYLKGQGLKTVNCWQEEFCRECNRCRFDAGELKCNANQQFSIEESYCKCNEGWNDCDGDWENGCESSRQCGACQSKGDCATDRCAPWGNVIQQFDCFKGEEWVEERGVLRLEGQCRFYPTKKMESHLGFDMWGDPFEALYPIHEQVEREMGWEWCGWELENNIRERAEIQNSFTDDSLKWFFEEYVPSSPSEWEKHIGGIYDSYWRIVNNNERTAQMLLCTGEDKFPEEYKPMDITYDTSFGSVRIWEVETTTDFYGKRTKILSPYMQIWVFPPKEFIKKEMQEAMELGMVPGPEGMKRPEFSPVEIEEMKKDKKLMDTINSISDKYGGEAKFLLNIIDGEELVFNALITINPEILIRFEPMKTYEGDYDAKITFDFDFFYSLISTTEKEIASGQIEYPPWEREGLKIKDTIKGVVDGAKMLVMIGSGVTSGSIQAEPLTSLSDGLTIMQMMFEGGPHEKK